MKIYWGASARKFMKWAMDQKTEEGIIKNLQFDPNENIYLRNGICDKGFVHFAN